MAGYAKVSDEKKYMAEHDLKTLIEAGRIRKDKARYKAAMACHAEQMKMLASMGDMKGEMKDGMKKA
jgi:hypothetical protein